MTAGLSRLGEDDPQDGRRVRILDAAERCIVRSGFHRTTMQDVAAEAGMSPGNLYRYFPSKDAIVAGLAERDRAEVAADFSGLAQAGDFVQNFAALAAKHFEDEPRERAILCLEIWAEATRNPAFAAITAEFEREVTGRLTTLLAEAQRRGAIDGSADPALLARLVCTLANGLFVRRATTADFSPERDVAALMAVIEAAFAGRIALQRHQAGAAEESA